MAAKLWDFQYILYAFGIRDAGYAGIQRYSFDTPCNGELRC